MSTGVILYGPPASGKDTISANLVAISSRYEPLSKLKVGSGRVTGYKMISPGELDELVAAGRILQMSRRYGNIYAVDRGSLDASVGHGRIPVVHAGRLADVEAVSQYDLTWLKVCLWCPVEATRTRLLKRGDTDVAARIAAWKDAEKEVSTISSSFFDLLVRTDLTDADRAARELDNARARTLRGR